MNTSNGIFVLDINHMNKLNFSFRSVTLIFAFIAIGFSSYAQSNKTVYLAWFETNNLKKDFQFITPKLYFLQVLKSFGEQQINKTTLIDFFSYKK